ncbi:MAG: aldo/keto reductase [Rhodobacteraceae bacterium]|nr:aldo/keto reductase [Paracoccaceae bacterium]
MPEVAKTPSRLALGTVQFGLAYGVSNAAQTATPPDEVDRILALARAAGIDTLDTAIAYGRAEAALGACDLRGFRIVTKLPRLPAGTTDVTGWVAQEMTQSLQRLRVDAVQAVLLHAPDDLFGPQGAALAGALVRLADQGLAGKIGVSVYSCDQLDRCCEVIPVALAQLPCNVLDRTLALRAPGYAAQGVEVHARSAFLQGLLLMPQGARHRYFDRWAGLFAQWDDWLGQHALTPEAACINYVRAQAAIARVVIGVETADQLQAILAIADSALPPLPDWPATGLEDLINPARWTLT